MLLRRRKKSPFGRIYDLVLHSSGQLEQTLFHFLRAMGRLHPSNGVVKRLCCGKIPNLRGLSYDFFWIKTHIGLSYQ